MLDRLPEASLALADEIADQCALIQRAWDEATFWLRAHGITQTPRGIDRDEFFELLHGKSLDRLLPLVRINKVDRDLFGYSDWLRPDWPDEFVPDELDEWVADDEDFPPQVGAPFPRRPVPRLAELPE